MACTWVVTCLLVAAASLAFVPEAQSISDQEFETLNRLNTFGYLTEDLDQEDIDTALSETIQNFQRTWGLEVTGELNTETLAQLEEPRCGDDDSDIVQSGSAGRRKRYHAVSTWGRCSLTYRIINYDYQDRYTKDLSDQEVEENFALAAKYWTDHVPGLSITAASSGEDITMYFGARCHGDGGCFDGSSGVLAHAYYPKGGDVHFDEDERWVLTGTGGGKFDFLQVAVHELGHSLGLGHSNDGGAIMYPYIRSNWNRQLGADDIAGIKTRFSCDGSGTTQATTTGSGPTPAPTPGPSTTQGPTTTTQKPDHCTPNPCLNGGVCNSHTLTFTCKCKGLFWGYTCQHKRPSRPDNPFPR